MTVISLADACGGTVNYTLAGADLSGASTGSIQGVVAFHC